MDNSVQQAQFGGFQDLSTGLSYDAEGNPVVAPVDVDSPVIQEQQLGIFKRYVHENGQVTIRQTEEADTSPGIKVPVPNPGDRQDVTGTGTADKAEKPAKQKPSDK